MSVLEILVLSLTFRNLFFYAAFNLSANITAWPAPPGLQLAPLHLTSSTQAVSPPPSPSNNFLDTLFRVGGRAHALSQVTWWIRGLNNWFCVLCGQMFEGRKVQTTKPFGKGGKERKGALGKRKLHILRNLTSHLRFILQRDFQDSLVSWIMGNLEGKTPPHAVTVAVLSINGCSSPTLSYGTGISLTMGTAAIFVVCKCADNMSYHTPEGLNSLGP